MRVILLDDVPKQGKKYDIKDVRGGFARNFLIPRKMAQAATPANIRIFQARITQEEKRRAKEKRTYEIMADMLQSLPLSLALKVGEKEQTFGSVSVADIQKALAEKGVHMAKDWIQVDEGIKTLGEKTIKIKFPHGVEGKITITVEAEK